MLSLFADHEQPDFSNNCAFGKLIYISNYTSNTDFLYLMISHLVPRAERARGSSSGSPASKAACWAWGERLRPAQGSGGGRRRTGNQKKWFFIIHLNAGYLLFKTSLKLLIKIPNKGSLKKFQLLKLLVNCNY